MNYFIKIIIIMLLVGMFGGIVNYLLKGSKKDDAMLCRDLVKSIFVGIGASFLVPLFLNMISSDIIEQAKTNDQMLLVFIGFCLIASVSSKSFINSMSDKILKELSNKINDVEENIKPIIHNSYEPISDYNKMRGIYDLLESTEIKILESIENSKYVYRTINALVKELQEEEETVRSNIQSLIEKGLIKSKLIKNTDMYYITMKGKDMILFY